MELKNSIPGVTEYNSPFGNEILANYIIFRSGMRNPYWSKWMPSHNFLLNCDNIGQTRMILKLYQSTAF